jgi:hypothetical protein
MLLAVIKKADFKPSKAIWAEVAEVVGGGANANATR